MTGPIEDDPGWPVKEEPNCYTCCDTGQVPQGEDGSGTEQWTYVNCPDCRPTPEQQAAQAVEFEARRVEWEQAVANGEIVPDESPF